MPASDAPESDDPPRGKRGSPANVPLAVSAVVLVMTGFVASMPGDLWLLYGMAAAAALWGWIKSDTPLRRMTGLVLTTISLTSAVMDFLVDMAGR
ncbi:MAG: hypothetical protein EOP88_13780 [Verrucomicrobiaceae bacterium]|nr:MAG: hypothetical protein EOP88_13780 [Verrucomicrobiaceae bacterium]